MRALVDRSPSFFQSGKSSWSWRACETHLKGPESVREAALTADMTREMQAR